MTISDSVSHSVELHCFPTARCNGVLPAWSFSPSLPPCMMTSLTVWGLLCLAAMWRTVQPRLSLTWAGLLLTTSVRLTSDRAELRQLEAISEVREEVSQLAGLS